MATQPVAVETNDENWLLYSQNFHSGSAGFQAAIHELTEYWKKTGPPNPQFIETIWLKHSPGRSTRFLIELIKADQAGRVKRGLDAQLESYLRHFNFLELDRSSAVSLAYAEFCNLQEAGRTPSINSFCEKYSGWENSIRQQLELHQLLSIPSNELARSEATARHFPKPGETIDRFELVNELGRGGSARVFLAHDTSLGGRCVALKVSADRSTEPEILARLEHDNIVPILSVHDAEDGLRLICMPYRGELTLDDLLVHHLSDRTSPRRRATDLLTLIREHPKSAQPVAGTPDRDDGLDGFPHSGSFEDAIAWIGCKLAEALAHAHAQGIFHRDIKPANVLVSLRSGPQLLDFNMARDPNALAQVEDRIRGGTLPYMAPEQLAAFHDTSLWQEIGVRSDIYSLGLVLRELAMGERSVMPLSPRAPVAEQVAKLLTERAKPWKSLASESRRISHAFDAIINKCLNFGPAGRYAEAADLAEDFHRLIDRRPLKYARNSSLRERTLVSLRPLRLLVAPAIVMAFLYFSRTELESTPAVSLPGVSASVIQLLANNEFGQSLADLQSQPVPHPEASTHRLIAEMIAQIELQPDSPQANELIKQIMQRSDLDKAVAQVTAAIGPGRHLDFLPLYRDFLLLQNRATEEPASVGQVEWQNLESRFLGHQEKWPDEIRVAALLAHLASMRTDYPAALAQIGRAIELTDKQGFGREDDLAVDLHYRQISYNYLLGAEKQRNNLTEEATSYYDAAIRGIHEFQKLHPKAAEKPDVAVFLAQTEVMSIIGLGDVQTDRTQYKEANSLYQNALNLLAGDSAKITTPSWNESVRQQIEMRQNTVRQLQQNDLIGPAR